VDLILCFDAVASPVRLVQRFGRTGRKRDGTCVLLLTQAEEHAYEATTRQVRPPPPGAWPLSLYIYVFVYIYIYIYIYIHIYIYVYMYPFPVRSPPSLTCSWPVSGSPVAFSCSIIRAPSATWCPGTPRFPCCRYALSYLVPGQSPVLPFPILGAPFATWCPGNPVPVSGIGALSPICCLAGLRHSLSLFYSKCTLCYLVPGHSPFPLF